MLGRLLDVKVWRGEGGGMSDNFFGGSSAEGVLEGVALMVSELNNRVKERAYQESLRGKYEVWRDGEVESAEKEWETFGDIVMECTNDVCGMKRKGRKGSEWWNEEWVGRCPKREELLRNGYREEIGLPMTDTGHREWL